MIKGSSIFLYIAGLVGFIKSLLPVFFSEIKVPELGYDLWFSTSFLLAGVFISYIVDRVEYLVEIGISSQSKLIPRVEEITTTEEFTQKMQKLIVGCTNACVLNLSDPADYDGQFAEYFKSLRNYFRRRKCTIKSYRRISSIGNQNKCRWAMRTALNFQKTPALSMYCLDVNPLKIPAMSYFLVERKGNYFIMFFHRIKGSGRMKSILIHDNNIGKFFLNEFDNLWDNLTHNRRPALSNSQINFDYFKELAEQYNIEDCAEFCELRAKCQPPPTE